MSLSRPILAARLRPRWRTLLAIAVLAGLGLGGAGSAIAIGRRTDSAYRRVAQSQGAVDIAWNYSSSPEEMYAQLEADPDPALGRVRQWVGFADVLDPLGISPDMLAPWRSEASLEHPFVIEGAVAEQEHELTVINEFAAGGSDVAVGDSLRLALLRADFSEAVPFDFVVTGIVTFASEYGMADDTSRTPLLLLSRAFGEAHPELVVWSTAGAVLDDGPPTRAEASALTQRHGWTLEGLSVDKEANARAALRPAVTSLFVLGSLGLIASVAVLAFALSRELGAWSADGSVLRSLGAPRRTRRRLDALTILTVVAASVAIALPTLFALSRFGPVGDLRRFDSDIGFRLDWFAAGAVLCGGLVAASVAVTLANRKASSPVVVPAHDLAASLLAGSATSSRRTAGMTMLLGLLSVAAAAATIPYVTSLSTLVDEPERYGQPWNAMARNRFGDQSAESIATVANDPLVTAASTITSGSVVISGRISAPAAKYEVVKGPNLLTIVNGRAAEGENEAVIGATTRRQLGVQLGDTVTVERLADTTTSDFGVLSGTPQDVTVVGDALFPAVNVPGGVAPRLDQGIMVGATTWAKLTGVQDSPEVTLFSTSSDDDAHRLAALFPQIEDLGFAPRPTEWFIGARPAEIRNVESARNFMIGGLVALSAVIAAVLGLVLRTVLAGQRRDLAVLRALGANRHQVRRIAWRQGVMLFVPLTVLGVPMGIALGRLLYSRLANSIGVASEPETPWWAVTAFVSATAAMAAIGVAVSGRAVGRVAPALSLREQ